VEEQDVQALEGGANDEELLECPNHRPSSSLKGKAPEHSKPPTFYKYHFEYLYMFDVLSYRNWLKTLAAYVSSPCIIYTP
jgi:hypothetical protein